MADISSFTDPVVAAIYEQYEKRNESEKPRPYLGASIIGKECARALWYDFRWASKESFDGRLLRLFQTGHLAEHRFVADLRSIGAEVFDVDPATGNQFGFVDHGGHMRGHMDGCGRYFPGGGTKWHVLEFKTHSSKSFADLKKKGVEKAKPQHYAQMMWYMGKSGMDRALYVAVDKNTDELYSERIKFDLTHFEQIQSKGERVIFGDLPPKISEDAKFYVCNFCSHNKVCHGGKVPTLSCRTCVHSTPERKGDGAWTCSKYGGKEIPIDLQRTGCPSHLPLPFLVTYADAIDAGDTWIRFKRKDNGIEFLVGSAVDVVDATIPAYTSEEISVANDHRIIADPEIEKFKTQTGAVIIG